MAVGPVIFGIGLGSMVVKRVSLPTQPWLEVCWIAMNPLPAVPQSTVKVLVPWPLVMVAPETDQTIFAPDAGVV